MALPQTVGVPAVRARASLWRRARTREAATALLFLLPLFVLVVALIFYPVYRAVWLSLTDKLVGYPERFVGLRNYAYLAQDDTFHAVIRNSLVFTVGSVGLKVVTGVLMALVLNNVIRGRNFFRGLLLLPWITSTVIIALTWRWMFDAFPGRGFFNSVLLDVGLLHRPIAFMATPEGAMMAVVVANWWRGFPFFGVSFLAALQTVPQELYDAADVDGAGSWQKFWRITLPSIKGVVAVVTLLSTIVTLNDFNIVWIMTRGGPGAATHIFATYSYELGIMSQRWGVAMAASMASLPLVALLIVGVVRYLHREEE